MQVSEHGISHEVTESGGVFEINFLVGSVIVDVENAKTEGAAEISVKSYLATHRAAGRRLLTLVTGNSGSAVEVSSIDRRGYAIFTTASFLVEAIAWNAAEKWCADNPEESAGDMMPEAHEPAPAPESAPAKPEAKGASPVTCPACGREIKLRQGVLAHHKTLPGAKLLLPLNEKGYCGGGGWTPADVAKKIEAQPTTVEDVAAAAKEAEGAIRSGPGFAPESKPKALPIPDNLPEIAAIFAEIEDRRAALREATTALNDAKEDHKTALSELDGANSRLFTAWKNGGRQVSLPLGESSGPAPAKAGDVTDQTWPFNGRDWTIKVKQVNPETYLALIPELTGDTEGHGQTVEAAVEESKGKAAVLLEDTDPGETPAKKKRSKKKASKKTSKAGPKKAAKKRSKKKTSNSQSRKARGKATVTEGRVDA